MAKVIAEPLALSSSASGLICCGVLTLFSSRDLVSVMACPFRFRYIGMIIGFTGEPCSPIVAAYGMPSSMWVAWFSPSVSRTRITAPEASLEIVDYLPRCFLGDRRLDPVLLEQPELVRHDDRGAVGQGDDADADLRCLGPVVGPRATRPARRESRQEGSRSRRCDKLSSSDPHRVLPSARK